MRKARSQTAECESRTDDNGIADLCCSGRALGDVDSRGGLGTVLADLGHGVREQLAILCRDDGLDGRTQHLDAQSFELVLHLDTDRERGLATESDIDAVWTLVLDDLADELGCDGQEVDLVGQAL